MTDLTSRLNEHLQKIREEVDYTSTEFIKELQNNNYKSDKDFAKLVGELLKATVDAGSTKFISPNFNYIKPLLIKDIKYNVNMMTKEGMDKQEAIDYLLDPTKYDDEVGNYVDTSFAEMYTDGYSKPGRASKILSQFEDNITGYLQKEIKKNYKQLIAAVK